MVHDTTDNGDEPSTQTARVLLTDGGSEAEQEADESEEKSEAAESDSEPESESTDESDEAGDSEAADEGEQTADESEEQEESADESEDQEESADESEDQEESADESEDQEESADESEETPEEPATIQADDEAVAEQTGDVGVDLQEDESAPSMDGEGDTASIIEVRNQVIDLSTDVIGRGLDGIIEVSRDEDTWRAVVEIIERRSVPDTQDILGQYEIELDAGGEVIGYRRLEKYRRSDTGPSQH